MSDDRRRSPAAFRSGLPRRVVGAALAAALALLLAARPARALQVIPAFLAGRGRPGTLELEVRNPDARAVEVTVSFRHAWSRFAGTGKVVFETGPKPGRPDWTRALRAFPRRFRLPPKGGQTVRILVRGAGRLAPGERWAEVAVRSAPAAAPLRKGGGTGVAAGARIVTEIRVPLLYRTGEVRTGVKVEALRPRYDPRGHLELLAHLRPTGNAAYVGTAHLTLERPDGTLAATGDRPFTLYVGGALPLGVRPRGAKRLPPGRYRARLFLETRRKDLPKDQLIQAPPTDVAFWVDVPAGP